MKVRSLINKADVLKKFLQEDVKDAPDYGIIKKYVADSAVNAENAVGSLRNRVADAVTTEIKRDVGVSKFFYRSDVFIDPTPETTGKTFFDFLVDAIVEIMVGKKGQVQASLSSDAIVLSGRSDFHLRYIFQGNLIFSCDRGLVDNDGLLFNVKLSPSM